MSEFEDTLRDAMRNEPREPDEAFVTQVEAGMDRLDVRRVAGLGLVAAAAVLLVAMLAVASGPVLAVMAGQLLAGSAMDGALAFTSAATPVVAVLLLGAFAVPLMAHR